MQLQEKFNEFKEILSHEASKRDGLMDICTATRNLQEKLDAFERKHRANTKASSLEDFINASLNTSLGRSSSNNEQCYVCEDDMPSFIKEILNGLHEDGLCDCEEEDSPVHIIFDFMKSKSPLHTSTTHTSTTKDTSEALKDEISKVLKGLNQHIESGIKKTKEVAKEKADELRNALIDTSSPEYVVTAWFELLSETNGVYHAKNKVAKYLREFKETQANSIKWRTYENLLALYEVALRKAELFRVPVEQILTDKVFMTVLAKENVNKFQ